MTPTAVTEPLPRPGRYMGGGFSDAPPSEPEPEQSYEEQLREAQLELIRAQTEAAEAVTAAARASQDHWWN